MNDQEKKNRCTVASSVAFPGNGVRVVVYVYGRV